MIDVSVDAGQGELPSCDQRLVAIPVLQGGTGNVAQGGVKIANLMLTCGDYVAYWNGKFMDTRNEVASGVYLYELRIDGQSLVKRMLVTK